jgi:hypothetical protein
MTETGRDGKPKPDVDKKTAKGKGEGGFAPHPQPDKSDKPAPFDPHYRANVEPPPVKPVGKKKP